MELKAFQEQIERLYGERDRDRGVDRTFVWLCEEIGELAKEVRRRELDPAALRLEVSDCLAWLVTLASQLGVDVDEAAGRFADGCPKCAATPCACPPN